VTTKFAPCTILAALALTCPAAAQPTTTPQEMVPQPAIAPIPAPPTFMPTVGGRFQFRYYANYRDNPLPVGAEELTNGFQFRRVRLNLRGNLPADFSYFIEMDFNRVGDAVPLDIYGEWALGDGWRLRFGQFVIPFLRERGVPDSMQLAVERSIVNDIFESDYAQGIMIGREWDNFRFSATFSDGFRTRATDFDSPREADWALTGRAEYRFGGTWAHVRDFTSWRDDPIVGLVGGAFHAQSGGDTFGTADRDVYQYTLDASLGGSGWNAFAGFVGRQIEEPGLDFTDFGIVAQAGFFIAEQTELFGRYDIVIPDDDRTNGEDFQTVTLGANYYFIPRSHALKLTGDVMIFLDRQSDSASIVMPNTGQGLLASDGRGQFVGRVQMQLVF
jgi:hypothetical protein